LVKEKTIKKKETNLIKEEEKINIEREESGIFSEDQES